MSISSNSLYPPDADKVARDSHVAVILQISNICNNITFFIYLSYKKYILIFESQGKRRQISEKRAERNHAHFQGKWRDISVRLPISHICAVHP
mgnify:CR=1 FL=1